MATYIWSASSPGDASTAGNWTPSGPPGAGDIAVFDGTSAQQCRWDIASVGEIHHQGQVVIDFIGTNVALQGLRMDTNAQISVSSATTLTFSGTAPYKSNSCYILIGATSSPFVNATSRSNLTLSIAATGTIFFDCGEYPKVSLASGTFTPEHVAPSVTNATDVKMLQLAIASGVNFQPASNPTIESRNKNWIIEGDSQSQFTCSATAFDGGYGNWTFQAISSGFLLPVSGNASAFSGTFRFQKMTIGNLNGVGTWASIGPATRLVLNDLTVEAGVSLKADDNVGSAILLVNRPTINGTWGFHPIADGYYVYPKYGDVTGFRSGGTGLTTLGTANQVLATNATADAIEWQTVSGGGGAVSSVVFTPQATNPETTNPENAIWIDSETGHLVRGDRDTESTVHFNVRNDEGATIPLGAPLYSKGEIGGSQRIKVGIADASDPAKMPAIGLAMEEMNTTSTKDGNMILTGILNENITITSVSEQDIIYVAPHGGTAPYLTVTRPTSGSHLVQNVGVCVKQASANQCQGMKVSAIGRTNDIPNGVITTNSADADYVYIDDGNTFKKITPSDLGIGSGGSGTVTSVAVTGSDGIEVDSGSPITTSGTIALGVNKTNMLSHLNVEDGADVTDTTNVTAAGALMDSEVTNLAQVKAFDSADYATAAQGTTADNALPKAGGTMTGEIEGTTITLNAIPADPATDTKVRLGESGTSSNMLRIQTNDGRIDIGPNNGTYAHLQTDRAQFYFSKPVLVDGGGEVFAYNDGLKLGTGTSASGGTTAITIADGSTDITVAGTTTSTGFIKTGGTSSEFLMADGSVSTGGGGSYTDADAIAAVEGEATLDLTGDVTIAAGKDFTVDTNTLHVDSANNRVGIGQSSPTTTLHVESSGTAIGLVKSSGSHANIRIDRASNSYDAALLFYTGGTLGWRIQESGTGNDLYIIDQDGSPDTARMRFHDAGTVEVSQAFQQGTVASAVLVADANGVLTAASNLQDVTYLQSGQAELDQYTDVSGSFVPPPANIQQAIDRIAQQVSGIIGGPIP